jgi:hypothetical protein
MKASDREAGPISAGVEWPQLAVATGRLDSADGPFENLDGLKRALLEAQRDFA